MDWRGGQAIPERNRVPLTRVRQVYEHTHRGTSLLDLQCVCIATQRRSAPAGMMGLNTSQAKVSMAWPWWCPCSVCIGVQRRLLAVGL